MKIKLPRLGSVKRSNIVVKTCDLLMKQYFGHFAPSPNIFLTSRIDFAVFLLSLLLVTSKTIIANQCLTTQPNRQSLTMFDK